MPISPDLLNRDLISDQFRGIGQELGAGPDLPSGVYGQYRVTDTGTGGRRISMRSQGELQDEAFQRQLRLNRQAAAPAIAAQRESIPLLEQAYGQRETSLKGRIDPLKERYQNILNDLTQRETKETTETKTALGREFGRRGVPLSSGLYDQTTLEKTQPISQFYGGQRKDTGLAQEADIKSIMDLIASLPIERSMDINKILQNIAGLESGAGKDAITQALSINQQQQQESQFDRSLEQTLKIAEMNRPQTKKESPYLTLGEGETLFDLNSLQSIFKNPKTKVSGSGSVDEWEYA